ncbi:MAG: hypothetical protein K2H01_04465 [Ruminococcus sp.]|nr:hypothetical protein [Ruminococcus sp.]
MKKTTISISFDEEKISALKMYLEQKNMKVENELEKALDVLYSKNVPAGVREFIDMKSGNDTVAPPKQRKQKPFLSSAVGAPAPKPSDAESATD